jgi:hypothetical protein
MRRKTTPAYALRAVGSSSSSRRPRAAQRPHVGVNGLGAVLTGAGDGGGPLEHPEPGSTPTISSARGAAPICADWAETQHDDPYEDEHDGRGIEWVDRLVDEEG